MLRDYSHPYRGSNDPSKLPDYRVAALPQPTPVLSSSHSDTAGS
jgi:hypothetical protein